MPQRAVSVTSCGVFGLWVFFYLLFSILYSPFSDI